MTLSICHPLTPRGLSQPLRTIGSANATSAQTSALAGGYWRGTSRRPVLVRTAQRDELDENDRQQVTHNDAGEAAALADANSISRTSGTHSSPLSFSSHKRLPNLSCSSSESVSCTNIHGIDDPCEDDSLDIKIFQYMVELVRSGTTEERAAEVISQWSGGGGVEAVDLRKLRAYFMKTTFGEVARQHAPPAVLPVTLTCLSYWSLGLLPGTDEAVLPPAVRGALVAANLLLLVYFASGSLRSTGRLFRVGRAALEFSGRAELVLLAMRDLASGHGAVIQAALGASTGAATPAATRGTNTSGSGASAGSAAVAAAAQRHASRRRVLEASTAAMRHVKLQAAAAAAAARVATSMDTSSLPPSGSFAKPTAGPPLPSLSSTAPSSSPWEEPQLPPSPLPPPAPPASMSTTPLSSLDSYLVLREAEQLAGGFDAAVSELGLAAEEAAVVAAMYARYGDSSRGGRFGDYELRRLLQEAGLPALSQEERRLVLMLHSLDKGTGAEAGVPGLAAGRGRGKGWLTFAEWAGWWAATTTTTTTPE
ncbi:hypothetical protein PLESTF_000878900 [Pleodorina starrii]|nr:hypothetical protein PLESTF_000878900 [Pleodorina starrii]